MNLLRPSKESRRSKGEAVVLDSALQIDREWVLVLVTEGHMDQETD